MTGYEIYEQALVLLGLNDQNGDFCDNNGIKTRALYAVNKVGADLCNMKPINDLLSEVKMDEKYLEAYSYGVGMLLALIEGDSAKHTMLCNIYNAKRAAAKFTTDKVQDVMPYVSEV